MLTLDAQAQKELLQLARRTLESYLSTGKVLEYTTADPALTQNAGAFVSLHRGEELRGCIGQISPDEELYKVVQHCALSAAFEDTRFSPVTEPEVPLLQVEISVLSLMERVHSVEDIEVGKHGLYISQGYRRGLLLPQVATQYAWTRDMFLAQTCRKAGMGENAWMDPKTVIQSFEAQVFGEAPD